MRAIVIGLAGLCAAMASSGASALEGMASYDQFNRTTLDPVRWAPDYERSRTITGTELNLIQRDWGLTSSDTGNVGYSFGTTVTRPVPVTQMKAGVRVNYIEVTPCAANPSPSQARARLLGSFFNTGTPTYGSFVGDMLAQVFLIRASNSVDGPGVLRVQANALVCTVSDCSASNVIGTASLGTVSVGTTVVLQMEWDKAGKRFLFSRDNGAQTGEIHYTQSDYTTPGFPTKQLGTRTEPASCLSGAQPTAAIGASFDNLQVNWAARP